VLHVAVAAAVTVCHIPITLQQLDEAGVHARSLTHDQPPRVSFQFKLVSSYLSRGQHHVQDPPESLARCNRKTDLLLFVRYLETCGRSCAHFWILAAESTSGSGTIQLTHDLGLSADTVEWNARFRRRQPSTSMLQAGEEREKEQKCSAERW
jgi:hypothetical protein